MEDTKTVETYMSPALCEALVGSTKEQSSLKKKARRTTVSTQPMSRSFKDPPPHEQGLFFQHISHQLKAVPLLKL